MPCQAVFVQDPETYLNQLGIELPCAEQAGRSARIERDFRVSINWETFFFCDAERKKAFEEHPVHDCGRLTDPVTMTRFTPNHGSPMTVYNGRPYYFLSDSTYSVFMTMPDSLALPHYTMTDM